ncbi:uncharacterized protein LOC143833987 isoform X6 [Paroedura picta]|uniref:uncharacterized protein LOC143833987 isoform X6 n=1 Tax=Paroedura picta TaxID=143630 RepID=UPI0040571CED
MATLNWPFQIVLQQGVNPAVKNMGPPQTRPPEEDSVIPRVIQVGTIGEFLGCEAPPKLTQGPEEGLAQCWEAQWQEVLKAVQPLTTGQETPQPLRTSAWDDTRDSSEVISDTGQWPTGEGDPQLLAEDDRDGLQVMSDPDNGGNGTTEEEAVRKEARDAEMQRQYFRQLHYQEGEGPRKLCVRLQEFCRGWLRPERHTKEQILELVVLEQFLAVLPQEIQSWLRNCGPQACSHAVALAEDFLRDEQQEDKMVAPCDVVLASSDQEWSPLDSRLRYFGGEAQTEDRRDSSLTGGFWAAGPRRAALGTVRVARRPPRASAGARDRTASDLGGDHLLRRRGVRNRGALGGPQAMVPRMRRELPRRPATRRAPEGPRASQAPRVPEMREELPGRFARHSAPDGAHGGEAVQLLGVRANLHPEAGPPAPPGETSGRSPEPTSAPKEPPPPQAFSVSAVREDLPGLFSRPPAPDGPHGRETVQVPGVRTRLYSKNGPQQAPAETPGDQALYRDFLSFHRQRGPGCVPQKHPLEPGGIGTQGVGTLPRERLQHPCKPEPSRSPASEETSRGPHAKPRR